MATFSQGAQNENLLIHRGKVDKQLKPELSKLKKAAKNPSGDVSNISKPLIPTRIRKDPLSALKSSESTKSTQKSSILTEDQIKKSHEWAEEGIEHMYFTGNDIQKLEADCMEKRVKEEDGVGDSGLKLEFEPEILSSRSGKIGNKLKPEVRKLTKTAWKTSGKAGEGPKTGRKALGDLSNISKPVVSNTIRKDLSSVPKICKGMKSAQKSNSLTKEQSKKCQKWAEEGIEHMYFTGNDIQKLERDCLEKRIKDEVAMAMSSMDEWGNDMFDIVSPIKDGLGDSELKLEFEPEILPSISDKRSDDKLDCLLDESESAFEDFDFKLELKIKDFYGH